MILSAHQPSYLPWLGYFHKISLSDVFVYYDHVSYSKKDFTTRNKIKTSQGPMWLSVPVSKGSTGKICDLFVDNDTPWQRRHYKSLLNCYGRAEYFREYIPFFEEFYEKSFDNFADMNFLLTETFLKVLGIRVDLLRSSALGISLPKNEGIFQMLETLKIDKIVFGKHGAEYVNIEEYEGRGYKCYFQDYVHPEYPQMYGEFLPYMSIMDLIFNCGPSSLTILQSKNIFKSELFD